MPIQAATAVGESGTVIAFDALLKMVPHAFICGNRR